MPSTLDVHDFLNLKKVELLIWGSVAPKMVLIEYLVIDISHVKIQFLFAADLKGPSETDGPTITRNIGTYF